MTELFYKAAGALIAPFRYAEREVKHFKEVAKEDIQAFMANLIKMAILGVVGLLFLLFLSITVATLINHAANSEVLGYAIVAGFYLLAGVAVYISKEVTEKKKEEHLHRHAKA
jgi:Kef-type K+ transport system membrane component KefB